MSTKKVSNAPRQSKINVSEPTGPAVVKKVKAKKEKEVVKCLDCGNEYDLFYDLQTITEVTSEGEEVDGIDIENERDPIRCALCRKHTRSSCNEIIQCEDCEEINKNFVWTGKYNDTIICTDCL